MTATTVSFVRWQQSEQTVAGVAVLYGLCADNTLHRCHLTMSVCDISSQAGDV